MIDSDSMEIQATAQPNTELGVRVGRGGNNANCCGLSCKEWRT